MQNLQSPSLSPISGTSRRAPDIKSPVSFVTPKKDLSFFSSTRLTPTGTTPRYSISELSSPRMHRSREQMYRNGPLLASTRFNVSLGMYTDAKSPGLTGRIVQYSNEQKETIHTHQSKYGSPGLFPIVHFFKKELPVISPRHSRVTIKLASPDPVMYNGNAESSTIVDDTNSQREVPDHDIGTRSVLDALKEISRKRINGGEDFDTSSVIAKRPINSGFGKRIREESPSSADTGSHLQAAKRMCIIDPVYASNTSSLFLIDKGIKRKADNDNVLEEGPVVQETKQVKVTNAETQTIVVEVEKDVVIEKPAVVKHVAPEKPAEVHPNNSLPSAAVFSENLHEFQKKNKLASILGAISGEKPHLTPINPQDSSSPKLISILSPQNKTKHSKHVHFDLKAAASLTSNFDASDVTKSDAPASTSNSELSTSTTNEINLEPRTLSELSAFTGSDSATTVTAMFNHPAKVTPAPPKQPTGGFKYDISLPLSKSETSNGLPEIPKVSTPLSVPKINSQEAMFAVGVQKEATMNPPSYLSTDVLHTFNESIKSSSTSATLASTTFTFGQTNTTFTNVPSTLIVKDTGASAFAGLGSINTVTSSKNASALPFGKPTNNIGTRTTSGTELYTPKQQTPLFNNASSFPNSASTTTFSTINTGLGLTTTPTVSSMPANTPMFNIPTTVSSSQPVSTAFNTPLKNVALISSGPVPSFGNGSFMKGGFGGPASTQNASTTVSTFGLSGFSTTTSVSMFGSGTATSPSFSAPVSSSSIFGASDSKATSSTTASLFGSAPGFGTVSTAAPFGNPTTSLAFNKAATTNVPAFVTNKATFGEPTTALMFKTTVQSQASAAPSGGGFTFGNATTSASAFGNATKSAPTFGNATTSAPAFGNATTSAPAFGSATTTAPAFGSATTSAPAFGNATTSVPAFGNATTSVPAFGNATTSVPTFGNSTTSAPAFGNATTSAPTFGNATSAPAFGTPTTSPPSFGASVASAFGGAASSPFGVSTTSTPGFGGPTTSAPAFGGPASSAPAFGAATTLATAFGAPSISTPTFGAPSTTAPAFGANTTSTAAFGTSTSSPQLFGGPSTLAPAFGASTTSAFGVTTTSGPAFGVPKSAAPGFSAPTAAAAFGAATSVTPAFGSATAGTLFGAPTTIVSAFGAPVTTAAFGAPATTTAFGNSGFGATSTTTTSAFSFGSGPSSAFGKTATTAASPFGFSTASPSTFGAGGGAPAFGGGTAPSFGAATTQSFVVATTQSFGVAVTTAQSSNFGASAQPPAFGSAAASTFGGKTAAGSFGATSTAAFGTAGSAPIFRSPQATPAFGSANNNNNNTFGAAAPEFRNHGFASTFGNAGFSSGGGDFKSQSNTFGPGSNAGSPFNATTQANFNSFTPSASTAAPQAGVFSFRAGSATAVPVSPPKAAVFSFGAAEAPKSGSFNFPGNAAVPNFNVNGPFGNNAPAPAYNQQFNTPNTGMFNIGTGSSVKSRTQLRAKRRT